MDEYIRQIQNYIVQMIPDEYEVSITENQKNNGVLLHGICIKTPEDVIAPIIYAENYYNNGYTAQEAAQGIINTYYEAKEKEADKFDLSNIKDFSKISEHICYKVIGQEHNKDLLNNIPWNEVCGNLALCYYIDLGKEENGSATITITNHFMDIWGIDKSTLHAYAEINTPIRHPLKFRSMNETLLELVMKEGHLYEMKYQYGMETLTDLEFIQKMTDEMDMSNTVPMYVLSTMDQRYGATAILYDNVIDGIKNQLGTNYWVIPSSLYEMIIIPYSEEMTPQELRDMVMQVNESEVKLQDQLSNSVYFSDGQDLYLIDGDEIPSQLHEYQEEER